MAAAARFAAGRYLSAASGAIDIGPSTHLVSPEWLAANLAHVTVLDGSWHMPAAARSGSAEHAAGPRIPRSRHFDIDAIADKSTGLPHMLPSAADFAAHAARLGISHGRPVVIYDTAGIFSAPRVWWTLRAFGHRAAAVLDGGLPLYTSLGYATESGPLPEVAPIHQEEWTLDASMITDMASVNANAAALREGREGDVTCDARPYPRFTGEAPEPRAGLRSGHIRGSRSVPFGKLLDGGRLKPEGELQREFADAGVDVNAPRRIVTSCGSGVTASVLYLGLAMCGRPFGAAHGGRTALYDGSWSEYGQHETNDVVTGPP